MKGEGRMEQLLDLQGLTHTGKLLEQLVDVVADGLIAGHEAVIGIQTGVTGMVVTGAQVHVAAQPSLFTPHNQNHLGVGLVTNHAVYHDHARFLQPTGQLEVLGLTESRP